MTKNVLVALAALHLGCSSHPTTRYIFDDVPGIGRYHSEACLGQDEPSVRVGSREGSLPGEPFSTKVLCFLPAEEQDHAAGLGTIVLRHQDDSLQGACGVHLLPMHVERPISYPAFFRLIDDPILRFKLMGIVAGLDPHREYHRAMTFDGVYVEFVQFDTNFGQGIFIELEVDGCRRGPDATVVSTDGTRRLHFPAEIE
jgi:hypothetical protein